MEITLKDSEIDNFIRYLNTASTIPLTTNDITVGDPIDLGTLPKVIPQDEMENYTDTILARANTEVTILPTKTGQVSGKGYVEAYSRLHIAIIWDRVKEACPKVDDRYAVEIDPIWRSPRPTLEDLNEWVEKHLYTRSQSVGCRLIGYRKKKTDFGVATLKIVAKETSLLYMGELEVEVVFVPIPIVNTTMDGFEGEMYIEENLLSVNAFPRYMRDNLTHG